MNIQKIKELSQVLKDNGFATQAQVFCLAEEAGEFVGAYRRWSGQARRTGTFEDMAAELADVVITAYNVAEFINIDLEQAINDKLKIIFSRGWRE